MVNVIFTMARGHLHMKIKLAFSQKPLGHFNQILCACFWVHGNETLLAGRMTKIAATEEKSENNGFFGTNCSLWP